MIICKFIGTEFVKLSDEFNIQSRDVTTGATDATEVAPKFSDTLTLSQPRGQILPTITEVAAKIFPWLRPWKLDKSEF